MRARRLVVCGLVCAFSAAVRADGVADESDLQFTIGAEAYTKGDFTGALEHFLASNRLVANRNVMFNIALAYGEAKQLRIELVRILGKVDLAGEPGTKVRIDDEHGPIACVLPCVLDLPPGAHIAYFERSGFTVSPQTFTITEKKKIKS